MKRLSAESARARAAGGGRRGARRKSFPEEPPVSSVEEVEKEEEEALPPPPRASVGVRAEGGSKGTKPWTTRRGTEGARVIA